MSAGNQIGKVGAMPGQQGQPAAGAMTQGLGMKPPSGQFTTQGSVGLGANPLAGFQNQTAMGQGTAGGQFGAQRLPGTRGSLPGPQIQSGQNTYNLAGRMGQGTMSGPVAPQPLNLNKPAMGQMAGLRR